MPAIKKKWMQTNMEDNSGKNESFEDEDRVLSHPDDATITVKKAVKRTIPPGPGMLKGLDGEVLVEKRKRFIPPAELKLSEWLDNNLEKRTEETVHLPLLYKYYTELCQASGSDILDVPEFNRMVKVKFGKSFGIQASSIYKAVIKERKMGEKKKSGSGLKLKDIVIEAINHFGNPWQGVRFFSLKHYIASRCPAMQIDAKPKILKRALEMGTNFGYIELTKGIGMMGSYRLPGAVEPPPKPKTKAKKEGESEGDGKDGEENSSSQQDGEKGDEQGDSSKGEGDKTTEDDGVVKEQADGSVAKLKKPKKVQTWSYSKMSHNNPARVEDTFPLAITYQSAPKAAGLPRIRRYILEKYGEEVSDSRWRKCLDHGVDKGYWEHVSGSGMSGRIHLLMDDFDPSSEQLEDRICAAIIACHDPKSASANQIKKYISRYHPDFGIDTRPEKFKKALIRAVEKKMIKQLSGLGASGTFMLVVPFTPSPSVLGGEDDSDDEYADSDDEPEKSAYVPRGTKSRGMPKVKTMEIIPQRKPKNSTVTSHRGGVGKKKVNNSKGRKLATSPVAIKKNKSGSVKKNKDAGKSQSKSKKRVRRSPSPLTDEEEEEEMVEYTPRKSQSRGGGSSRGSSLSPVKVQASAKKGGKKEKVKASPAKKKTPTVSGGRTSSKTENVGRTYNSSDESDNEDVVEYTPRKSASRGGKINGTPKSSKKIEMVSDSDGVDDGEVEYTPRKSASRGGATKVDSGKSKSSKKRKADSDLDDDDDDDDNDDELRHGKKSTPKSEGKSGRGKKRSGR